MKPPSWTFSEGANITRGAPLRIRLDREPTDAEIDAGAAFWKFAGDCSSVEVEEFAGRAFPSLDRRAIWFIPDEPGEPAEAPELFDADGIPFSRP